MEEELREYLMGSDKLADYPNVTPEQITEIVTELANRVFLLATEIVEDIIEDTLGVPCGCPNCDDPHNGSECMRNFCSVCRDELGWDATWPEQCDRCQEYGYTVENGGR